MKKFITSHITSMQLPILQNFSYIANPFHVIQNVIRRKLLLVLALIFAFPYSAWGLSIANTGLHFQEGFDIYRFTVDAGGMGEGEDGIRDFEIEMNLIRDGKVLETGTLQIEHFASSEADSRIDLFFEADMTDHEPPDGKETGPISFTISKAIGKIDGKEIDFIKENDLEIYNFVPAKINIVPNTTTNATGSNPQQEPSNKSGLIRMERGVYYLIPVAGEEIYIGDMRKVSQNKLLSSCLEDANRRAIPVTLDGKIELQDGSLRFSDNVSSCAKLPHTSQIVNYEGCYGPKIAGLQLGMSEPAAKNIIAEYAQKNNIRFDEGNKSLGAGEDKFFDVAFFGKNTADRFAVGKNYFGVSDLQSKDFMQQFMQEYNIPEVVPEKYQGMFGKPGIKYTYVNKKDGYSISIFPNEIMVSSVKK